MNILTRNKSCSGVFVYEPNQEVAYPVEYIVPERFNIRGIYEDKIENICELET